MYLENSIIGGSMCIVNNAQLVKKTNFPRELIAVSHIVINFITYLIIINIIIGLSLSSGVSISLTNIIIVIPIIALMVIFSMGAILLLSAIVVYIRDIGHFMLAISRMVFWTAPTVYTVYDVSGLLEALLWCNPMTWYIAPLQDIICFNITPSLTVLMGSFVISIIFIVVGPIVFAKLKNGFAERL